MKRYLLSTGSSTSKVELYMLDLLRLNISIFSGDIPNSAVGFNIITSNIHKDELLGAIESRLQLLVENINKRMGLPGYTMKIDSVELVGPSNARVVVSINSTKDTVDINL